MVHLERKNPEVREHLTDEGVQIVMDALLHEMERYNKALDLVTDENVRHAIDYAKKKVYRVYQVMNNLLPEDKE